MADPFTFKVKDEVDNSSDSKGKFPMLPSETSSEKEKKKKRKRKRKKKAQITDLKYMQVQPTQPAHEPKQADQSASQLRPPQTAPEPTTAPAPEPTAAPATRTLPKSLIKPKVPTSLEEVMSMYSKEPDTTHDDMDLLEVVAMKGWHFNMPSWWRPGGYDD